MHRLSLVHAVHVLQRLGEHGLLVGDHLLGPLLGRLLLQGADLLQALRTLGGQDDVVLAWWGDEGWSLRYYWC